MRNHSELVEGLSHVTYEYNMLIGTATLLEHIQIQRKNSKGSVDKIKQLFLSDINYNSVLESFLIHARNLIDFFNSKEFKKNGDDILLRDFNIKEETCKIFDCNKSPDDKTEIEKQYDRMSKEISHLTYKRTNKINDKL